MTGIYIHIPFCKNACVYCDFHFSTNFNGKADLVDAICKEIELRKNYLSQNQLDSIYFGGGTPSLLNQTELEKIFETIHKHFEISPKAEITLEANPDDINPSNLTLWKNAGINRLSIGLQSFNNEELKWMNRAHNAQESESSVKLAQDSGFNNITIDLIYGSKFQTLNSWEFTLQKAVNLNTQHISAYNLTIEQQTVLGIKLKKGIEPQVNDEVSSKQFLLMSDYLTNNEFIHYEISNFSKKNFFAVHNSNYWLGGLYTGIGPSAHSFNGSERQWNIRSNAAYIKNIATNTYFEVETLSVENKYNEYILTRLRTIWGCDINEIERNFGKPFSEHFIQIAQSKKEFIHEIKGVFSLNTQGRLIADHISAELFV